MVDASDNADIYRVLLDGRWNLEDLYDFPHLFEQCYSFVYCLDTELDIRNSERIRFAFESYPWRGGYSYVNIYGVMAAQIPYLYKPSINSMYYASPGWIDILLKGEVAVKIARSINKMISESIVTTAETYAKVSRIIFELKNERQAAALENIKLRREQYEEIISLSEQMAKGMGFDSIDNLHELTGDPEVSLKLLAAHYRRMKQLLDFVLKGKAALPNHLKSSEDTSLQGSGSRLLDLKD